MPLVYLALILIVSLVSSLPVLATTNVLAIGDRSITNEPIDVPINPLGDLNLKSKQEIFLWRREILYRSPTLMSGPYEPDSYVFHSLEDHRPWWGVIGAFVWGAGERSIEGPAEESRFILNPLLLVGANPNCALIWKTDKLNQAELADPSFPFCWLPKSLKWYPSQALVQATYDVSEFNQRLKARNSKLNADPAQINRFGLIAYNARDFGFKYIYLDVKKSMNVGSDEKDEGAVEITQLIHCGNSCQYPGGCNNMSPAIPQIDHFRFTDLPARSFIRLWYQKPENVLQKPDLTYLLDLR
jgi:hypothetical protein